MWELAQKTIINPTKQHITFVLLLVGALLILFGTTHAGFIDGLPLIPKGTGEIVQKVGSAILGAGVFAVIMKSAQFTEYFQKSIHEVFYSPDSTSSLEVIKHKWEILTRSLLKNTLPESYQDASSVIMKRFFNDELQFHFEDFSVSYDFTLKDDGKTLQVVNKTTANIVISPKYSEAKIVQRIKNDGKIHIKSLLIDDIPMNLEKCFSQDPENALTKNFELVVCPKSATDKTIKMERVYEYEQDLTKEPYAIGSLERYIKGMVVKAKASGCGLYFRPTGAGAIYDVPGREDGEGYTRWVLADRNTLLLPGQGYIFVLTNDR
ncbi:MAG TPA: hypothetical protein DD418_05195 [Pseudomonas sp.]|nr:hypothetical protein [Pseudomonas sp.]